MIDTIPVSATGIAHTGDPTHTVPFIRVDAQRRHDVADLFRVHTIEGTGTSSVAAHRSTTGNVIVAFKITSPVRCAFTTELVGGVHNDCIDALHRSDTVILTFGVGAEGLLFATCDGSKLLT